MESIFLPSDHFPESLGSIHIAHFHSLSNSASLLDRLISASKLDESHPDTAAERSALDFAFIDPTRLVSKQHLVTACLQAIIAASRSNQANRSAPHGTTLPVQGGMKTKTPHSEIIFALSPGNNIGESLKRFGLSSKSKSVVLVKICASSSTSEDSRGYGDRLATTDSILDSMISIIDGQLSLSPLEKTLDGVATHSETNWKEMSKIYKLNMPLLLSSSKGDGDGELAEKERRRAIDIIVSAVAMKNVAA
ncbi:CGI-121-domain-containing protein [Violaceomyces palustris]|uniref:CGI-121-domain-containing protein n=1 Tax=Violaceomyces palustris TaxID=1673888 RepID=A0ACD0NUU7_9BASI|nr:CGI-121-domain-containing protein [Violaceomyces palustris]